MQDKYYVYRPMIELIGRSEGTAPPKGRGYNETLGYGKYTDGPVNLVDMSLDEVDRLQTRMLNHPKNTWNSSAAGLGQIVRTTRRAIEKQLDIPGTELFDENMQDRMICYLLGARGIDKWLAGRLKLKTLINNLSKEWASLPRYETGEGHYKGQHASVSVRDVTKALNEVRKRHEEDAPEKLPPEVEKKLDKPTVKQFGFFERIGYFLGIGGMSSAAWLQDWKIVVALGGVLLVLVIFGIIYQDRIASAVRKVRKLRNV